MVVLSMIVVAPAWAETADREVYTLYRNSVTDPTMRIHVGTFDTTNGAKYNAETCNEAADLFQHQDGVRTRFWCEQGRFHE